MSLRTALKIMRSFLKSCRQSLSLRLVRHKAAQQIHALQALLFHPFFEVENSQGSDKKSVERKIAYEKTTGLKYLLKTLFESK